MPLEDYAERTEPATPRKRQEARERGQVAKSTDLTVALILLGAFAALAVFGDSMAGKIGDFVKECLKAPAEAVLDRGSVVSFFTSVIVDAVFTVLPFALVVAAVAICANAVQVGAVWASNVISPDIDRLNPMRGLSRIFSLRGLVRACMGVGKLAVIAAVVASVLLAYLAPGGQKSLFALFGDDIAGNFQRARAAACELGIICCVAMLLLAALDYAYQRWQYERDLRMTRQEVREELKRFEGDPKMKERRRRMQRQIALRRFLTEVPKADVVVTNPTEYAVALAYRAERDNAPRVVAKGEGLLAERIRQIAMEAGVPVLQRPALARALYRQVEVGAEIPQQLYEAVAEVLAYVWRMAGKTVEQVS